MKKKTVVLRIISLCIFLLQYLFSLTMTYCVVSIAAGSDNEICNKSITAIMQRLQGTQDGGNVFKSWDSTSKRIVTVITLEEIGVFRTLTVTRERR